MEEKFMKAALKEAKKAYDKLEVPVGAVIVKDVQDIIKANVEKANKKKEKKGIDVNKVASAATTSTKSIKSKANVNTKKVNSQDVKYKPGSMAAKANMVKNYEDKNRK